MSRVTAKRHAPDTYRAMAAFDRSIRLDERLRELVRVRTSQINGCAYCIELHTRSAREQGETEQRLYALAAWRESPLFSERERAALALADAVALIGEAGVPDDVYDAAAAAFGEEELAHLIMALVAINAWNRIAVTSRMVNA